LQQCCGGGEAFLKQAVTGNETWVHYYEPATKCQSTECKHMSALRTRKFKCAFCWQSYVDTVLGPFLSTNRSVDRWSTQYCAMLEEELKPAICSEHRVMLTNGVLFHHDNADLICQMTTGIIQKQIQDSPPSCIWSKSHPIS